MTAATDERDREDMARLVAGHDGALDDLMERHAERLFHYLLRVLQNETEATDLAQEAFVRVYEHRASFNARNKFSTWLYAIATNLARDLKRYRVRHPNVSLNADVGESGSQLGDILPDAKPNPGELMDSEDRSEIVRRAVAALPEDLRVPLVLAEYEDKSQEEIGKILRCSAKAVEMRIYRARKQLRSALEEMWQTR